MTHAADGRIAWKLVRNQCFDAVLLDVDMPGLDGAEVCRRIRSAPLLMHLPVILCSGRLDLPELAKQARADDFVEKGAGFMHLAARINRLLLPLKSRPKLPENS